MGKLSFENNKFWFSQSRDASVRVDHLAQKAGFQWNKESLRWVTRKIDKAVKLRRFADENAERKFKNTFIDTSLAPPEQIIYPDHLTPKSWQIESAWWACTRSVSYIADEAGLGKTITSILCMNSVPGRALVICPPFLVHNWVKEIQKWGVGYKTIAFIETGKPSLEQMKCDIIILPDSLVINPLVRMHLFQHKFTWLFVDEAHRYKEA